MAVNTLVEWRNTYNIPIWVGEFGGPDGGNPSTAWSSTTTDPEWQICEQLFYRCEEQAIGWNFWLGYMTTSLWTLNAYKPLFPLKIFNSNLVRQPWSSPVPELINYITASVGVNVLQDYELQMRSDGSVTFSPGITVNVLTEHRLADTDVWQYINETKGIVQSTTITNEEETTAHPGDWNIYIYSLGYG